MPTKMIISNPKIELNPLAGYKLIGIDVTPAQLVDYLGTDFRRLRFSAFLGKPLYFVFKSDLD